MFCTTKSIKWIGLEQFHNLVTISNCLFHNNDAPQVAFVVILNVSDVEISGCEFYQNRDSQSYLIWFGLEQFHNLVSISNCLFHNNVAQLALVAIQNVSYVEISRCEFYQNEGQTYLILISVEEVHNLTISNCLFCNNDAQETLIMTFYVFNVEISGCKFYQNKGQVYLILIPTYFF